jgi:hypothetical protein
MITPTIQTDIGEEPNTRDRKSAAALDHTTSVTSPTHQPSKKMIKP